MRKFFTSNTRLLILVSLVVFAFFLPGLIQGKMPIPSDALINLYHPWRDNPYGNYIQGRFPAKNTLITDPVLQTYPWRKIVIENLKSGILPLWNPYSFAGQPLLANFQSSVFQVNNILFAFLPFKSAWAANIILPSLFSAVFTFLFLINLDFKSQKLSKTAAFFGATILPFSGFFISWLEWGTIVTTAMWLPLILLTISKIFTKNSPYWFVILIFAVSQTFFSGHFQTAFYILLASFIFAAFSYNTNPKLKPLTKIVTGVFLGILIASPQIVPSIEFAMFSTRNTDQGYFSGRADWFIPIQHLIQIIAPDFFGNPTTLNYWGIWNYGEFVSYFGIVPLSLALFSILSFKKSKSAQYFVFLFFTALIFGLSNPISKIPYILNLPIISSFQPSRIIFLLVFSGVCLSAIGLDLLVKEKHKLKKFLPVIFISAILLILLFLSAGNSSILFKGSPPDSSQTAVRNLIFPLITSSALLVLIAIHVFFSKKFVIIIILLSLSYFELFRFAYKFTPFTHSSLVFPKNNTTDFLLSQKKPFRVMTTDRRIMHPNSSTAYRIESVDGYDPLYLKSYSDFVSAWQSSNGEVGFGSFNRIITPQKVNFNFINISNVKYILSFDTIENENLQLVFQEGETKVYENKITNPRAYFVKNVLKKENRKEELAYIASADFNPAQIATSSDISIESGVSNSVVQLKSYNDNQLNLTVSTDADAPLVVSNINYPGWKAFIDGKEQKILTANAIFQLLIIPRGTHDVRLKYEPKSFTYGLMLMSIGIIGSITLFRASGDHGFQPWVKPQLIPRSENQRTTGYARGNLFTYLWRKKSR